MFKDAKRTLNFYIERAWKEAGLPWTEDNIAEVNNILDDIEDDVKDEIKRQIDNALSEFQTQLGLDAKWVLLRKN